MRATIFTSRVRKVLSTIALVAVVVVLGLYIRNHPHIFSGLLVVRWEFLVILFAIRLLLFSVQSLQTKVFLGHFKVQIRFTEGFGLSVVSNMTNVLAPLQGGALLRGGYLRSKHDFSYATFASVQFAGYLLSFLVNSAFGAVLTVLFYLRYGVLEWRILSFFLALVALMLLILLVSPSLPRSQSRMKEALRRGLDGWHRLKSSKTLIFKISFLNLVSTVLVGARLFVGYEALSFSPGFLPVLLMGTMSQYAILVTFTPGNLGLGEATLALISQVVGIGFDEGLGVALLLRGISLTAILLLGPLSGYLLTKGFAREKSGA